MSNIKKSVLTGFVSGAIGATAFTFGGWLLANSFMIISGGIWGGIFFIAFIKITTLVISNRTLRDHCNYKHKFLSNAIGSLTAMITIIILVSTFFARGFPNIEEITEMILGGMLVQFPVDGIIPLFFKSKKDLESTHEELLDDVDFQDR